MALAFAPSCSGQLAVYLILRRAIVEESWWLFAAISKTSSPTNYPNTVLKPTQLSGPSCDYKSLVPVRNYCLTFCSCGVHVGLI